MKKITVVFLEKEKDQTLNSLAASGVVHLHDVRGTSPETEEASARMARLERALIVLQSLNPGRKEAPGRMQGNPLALADRILELEEQGKSLREESEQLKKEQARFALFGDLCRNDLALIRDKGTLLHFYALDKKALKGIPEDQEWLSLGRYNGKHLTAFIGESERASSDWEPLELPEMKETDRQNRLAEIQSELAVNRRALLDHYFCQDELKQELAKRQDLYLWEGVKAGLADEEALSHLGGFVPESRCDLLKKSAAENGWALLIEDPSDEDSVPTLLKTNAVTGLLKPVLDMLGILPGYREYDVSFFFLLFFSIFTAMLIGDAGYGFLFLGAALAGIIGFAVKGKKVPVALALLTVLSVVIIVWGAATGTWFSSKTLLQNPFLSSLRLGYFSGTVEQSNWTVMFISFFLGVFQLCLACLQGFIREFPQPKSFARLGWLATLVVVYFFVLSQLLKIPFPPFMVYVLVAGVGVIFIFGSQEKGRNFFKGLLLGFTADLLPNILNVIGTFSNIMSYIRLFAVGMASVKIAEIFNAMAAPLAHGPSMIGAVLILIVGHGLNIALGLLSVMVHAIRLNILEYSGQLGMEWSGFKYDPFRVQKTENESRGESI